MRWLRTWALLLGVVLALNGVVTAALADPAGATRTSNGWNNRSLHLVGSPIVADHTVLILNVSAKHELEISAIDSSNGSVIWSDPFSTSLITPGVAFTPVAIGNTVLVLSPAAGLSNPAVKVRGVNAATGKTIWTVSQPLVFSDAPIVCATGRYFCLPTYLSSTTTALVALDPMTGAIAGNVQGPLRNMAVAPPGAQNASDLWQTDNSSVPTLMQTSATGTQVWSQTVASLFGGDQFDPNYGWDFMVTGQIDVGSVGVKLVDKAEPLGGLKTLGISTSNGSVEWSTAGSLFCGGGLQFLSADVICQYMGSARSNGTIETMHGVKLTLKGLDPVSGASTWTDSVRDAQALSLGTNVAFKDSTHLVVQTLSDRRVLLDVSTGKVAGTSGHEVFWCEQIPIYKVTTIKGIPGNGKRVGEPTFRACSAEGKAVNGVPPSKPSTVGVTIGGLFIWPSPTGLQAISQSGPN